MLKPGPNALQFSHLAFGTLLKNESINSLFAVAADVVHSKGTHWSPLFVFFLVKEIIVIVVFVAVSIGFVAGVKEDIAVGDVLRRMAKCPHACHAPCLERWLATNPKCPVCGTV